MEMQARVQPRGEETPRGTRVDSRPREGTPAEAPEVPPAAPDERAAAPAPATGRLLSLDAFRGLTILGMLLVNNIALDTGTPRHLTHAPWNGGVYFADLVFPWFLFIVGVALPYAAASFRRKGLPLRAYLGKVLGRTATLFLLGCLLTSSIAHRPIFGLDVLQLIGLAYGAGALLYELPLRFRLPAAAALLIGHWAVIRFLPVPGVGAGAFTESQNAIFYLNDAYLRDWGMKGLVSVVPTTALVLIGTAVGDLLRSERWPALRKLGGLLVIGAALSLAGWLWSLDLPFNKAVWTASYILLTAGLGCLVLGAFYGLVDLARARPLALPLVVFGSNAIVAYVAPILVKIHMLQEWIWARPGGEPQTVQQALLQACVDQFGRRNGGWAYTAGYILVWWLVLLVLYRKRLFLRV
jgi:predicted acyltransferase